MDYHVTLGANTDRLAAQMASGSYRPAQPVRLLMEKSKGLCRQIVLPSLDDALVLQRLSDSFFSMIRGKTPTAHAYFEPDNFAFSAKDRTSYGSFAAWLHFQNKVFEMCNENKFIVTTDIANYYDHIGYDSLRNTISSTVSVSETVLDLLVFSLSSLTWQPDYMPRPEVGLPQIDLDAPRVLGHSFLFDLDRYAKIAAPDRYTRFMDDINFGVTSIAEAKTIVRDVDLILHTRQVRLNSGKTLIFSAKQARRHFRIDDHAAIDAINADLNFRRAVGLPIEPIRQKTESLITLKARSGDFDDGHGEKILKRLLTLARQTSGTVHRALLLDILRRRPSCREAVMAYLSTRPLDLKTATAFEEFISDPTLVDDVPFLIAPSAIVEMSAGSRIALQSTLDRIAQLLADRGVWGIYGSIWLLSKYGSADQLLDLFGGKRLDWFSDPTLGRLVGGTASRFVDLPQYDRLVSLIGASGNAMAASALRFHSQIARQPRIVSSLQRYLLAPNPSKSSGIAHEKFLLMMSVFKSPSSSESLKRSLIHKHVAVWRDAYYRQLAVESLPPTLRSLVR